jgi:hypothetical protein
LGVNLFAIGGNKIDLGMKIQYEKGKLSCWNCIHCDDCEQVNECCVANYILDNEVVHLTEKEIKK